jgi:hypothetical protein
MMNQIPEADQSDILDRAMGRHPNETDFDWLNRRIMLILGLGAGQKPTLEMLKTFMNTLNASLIEMRKSNDVL